MRRLNTVILILLSVPIALPLFSQSKYLPDKKGAYSYNNNSDYLGTKKPEFEAFGKNGKALSDFFFSTIPLMQGLTGFDLSVTLFGWGEENYLKQPFNYGMPGELVFCFQLFLIDEKGNEGKWSVEPPKWEFSINNTQEGHAGLLRWGKEGTLLSQIFAVYPLVREIAPGVRYYDNESRGVGSLVIYNPERPPYWLPVTTREVITARMEDWKDDKMLFDYATKIVSGMTEAELNAPAWFGGEENIIQVNGKGEGFQIMRFNPDYWDRNLPASEIQFITLMYNEHSLFNSSPEDQKRAEEEYFANNNRINYHMEVNKLLPLKELPSLIKRGK